MWRTIIDKWHLLIIIWEYKNISELLKKVTDSYRLLIAGAAELNNIPEAESSYVKDAVKRADKLGETIDHLITLLDKCGESYFQYCSVLGNYIMNKSNQKDILTEIDDELLYDNSSNIGQVKNREDNFVNFDDDDN